MRETEEAAKKKSAEPYHPRPWILSREPVCVSEDATLFEAAHLMRENHIGDLIVVSEKDGGQKKVPIGIITDRDLAIETYGQGISGEKLLVSDILTRETATGLVSDDVFQLIEKMKAAGVGRLPLLNSGGELAGVITAKRLTRILLQGLNDLFEMSEQRKQNEYRHRQ